MRRIAPRPFPSLSAALGRDDPVPGEKCGLSASGAGIVTTEMVLFEWMGKAGTPTFRRILQLVK